MAGLGLQEQCWAHWWGGRHIRVLPSVTPGVGPGGFGRRLWQPLGAAVMGDRVME